MTTQVLVVDDGVGLWGAQRLILRLAPYLHAAGYAMSLLSPRDGAFAKAWPEVVGGQVLDLPEHRPSARSRNGRLGLVPLLRSGKQLAGGSRRIVEASRAVQAGLVVANSFWTHFDASVAGRMSHTPTVLYLHEQVEDGFPRLALRSAVRMSRAAIAVSNDVAESVGRPRKVRVVPNGVDASRFSPGPPSVSLRSELSLRPEAPLIVTMCRLDQTKQVDHVVRAVTSLTGALETASLAVVGDTTTSNAYAASLRQLGSRLLGDRIRFVGAREDVVEILRTADLYVLASRLEGMPLGILEAQATGCPVVAYPAAGVRDVIADEETGLIALENDWHSLAAAIARVLSDRSCRDGLVERARRSVLENFTLDLQAERVLAVMDQVMTTRGGSPSSVP